MAASARTFPNYRGVVQELVDEPLELTDQPLLLALYYAPSRDTNDVFLFEVADKFGGDRVTEENAFMEVTFVAKSELRIGKKQRLHLVIANPNEFRAAIRSKWPDVVKIAEAIAQETGLWRIYYDPNNINQRGGDVNIWVSAQDNSIVRVLRGQ